MRFYYFLTPSLTFSPPRKKPYILEGLQWETAQLLSRGSLGAHYLLYQPPQWLALSTGSSLMHHFPTSHAPAV